MARKTGRTTEQPTYPVHSIDTRQADEPMPEAALFDGVGGSTIEAPPWYQYTDWWEGLSDREIEARIHQASQETGPGGWIVVPPGYLSRPKYVPSSDDLIEAVRRMPPGEVQAVPPRAISGLSQLAWDIYMELTKARGYSPEHAKNAWRGARDFEREGEAGQEEPRS